MSVDTKLVIAFWVLAAIAILLGIVISADEYITEKIYSAKGETDGTREA